MKSGFMLSYSCRISHDSNFLQYINSSSVVHETDAPEKNAIDFNYNTSLESSRNVKESSKSPSSVISDRHHSIYNTNSESAEDEEEAQDLSMSNAEIANHIT